MGKNKGGAGGKQQQQQQQGKDRAAGVFVNNGVSKLPRKKMYRARAHSNPLSDQMLAVPDHPDAANWESLYPSFFPKQSQPSASAAAASSAAAAAAAAEGSEPSTSGQSAAAAAGDNKPMVRFADVGCGFGGLLIKLSPLYPDTLMVGMELREKVSEYVKQRIESLRTEHPGQYGNCSCIRTNAMKYLPHYFRKEQLTKMFFLFPDPHFKASNHRRRIINTTLLTEYAYIMAPGGWLYTITDVPELGQWMQSKLDAHPMFERVSEEELDKDPAAGLLTQASEEGQKVARNAGSTYRAVYRRLPQLRHIDANPEVMTQRR